MDCRSWMLGEMVGGEIVGRESATSDDECYVVVRQQQFEALMLTSLDAAQSLDGSMDVGEDIALMTLAFRFSRKRTGNFVRFI